MRLLNWRLGVCALAVAGLAISPVFSAPDDDITGDWKLDGSDGIGHYAGTVKVEQQGASNAYTATMAYKYDNGKDGAATFVGTRSGQWLTGKRTRSAGITGVLSNIAKKPQNEWFQVSQDGLKLTGTYASTHEYFRRDAKPSAAKATITADQQITLVPNAPATITGAIRVVVSQGKVKLDVKPAGALKLSQSGDLGVGTYDIVAEPVLEGSAEVQLLSGATPIATAKIEVVKEKLYLILFGYMGPEVTYLDKDLNKTKQGIVPKLQAAGYTVIEDGSSYSQSSIDAKLNDKKSGAKKVVVDWCTTASDFTKYFARGSAKGYTWSSHGFMEPFPGCPDSELKTFEARQWSCAENHPETTGSKHFIREWRSHFDRNAYSTMDFALNHSCCTGGLGADYEDHAWEYCTPATRDRAQALFGTLPEVSSLSFTTHEALKGRFTFQQNYDGSAYFGMWDVSWSSLTASIKP